jgi:TrpR-related protein YerC/YecD
MSKFLPNEDESVKELYNAICKLESTDGAYRFFEDLLTINEIHSMAQRFHVALMLDAGEKYNDIVKKTGASTATISRVNKCLIYGSGGYQEIIDKIKKDRLNDEG